MNKKIAQLKKNITTGYNAESKVAGILRELLNGQDKTFRGADDKGIDQILQFENPFCKDELLYLGVQVKSGKSNVIETNDKWIISKLSNKQINITIKANIPVILVYVRQETKIEYYWKIITTKLTSNKIYLSKKSKLNPAILYDIMVHLKMKDSPKNLSESNKYPRLIPPLNITLRNYAKQYFKKNLQGKKIKNSVIGTISVSCNTWRHITRKSRKSTMIYNTLEILPAIEKELQNSMELQSFRRLKTFKRGNLIYEVRLLILKSNNVIIENTKDNIITIPIRECIVYPTNWSNRLDVFYKTTRELTLESFYIKK